VLASRESFLESKGRHFVDMYLKSITPIESKNNFLPPPGGRIKVGGGKVQDVHPSPSQRPSEPAAIPTFPLAYRQAGITRGKEMR